MSGFLMGHLDWRWHRRGASSTIVHLRSGFTVCGVRACPVIIATAGAVGTVMLVRDTARVGSVDRHRCQRV
jgi:hypothetical protein